MRHAPRDRILPSCHPVIRSLLVTSRPLSLPNPVLHAAPRRLAPPPNAHLCSFGSVIHDALPYLRRPLGFLVFLWLLAFVVAKVFHAAIAPVCWMPVISSASLFRLSTAFMDAAQRAGYRRLAEIQSKNFDDLLSNTVSGSALSLDIENAEMAMKDLVTLVEVSVRCSELIVVDYQSRSLRLCACLHGVRSGGGLAGRAAMTADVCARVHGAHSTLISCTNAAAATPYLWVLVESAESGYRRPAETSGLRGLSRVGLQASRPELGERSFLAAAGPFPHQGESTLTESR